MMDEMNKLVAGLGGKNRDSMRSSAVKSSAGSGQPNPLSPAVAAPISARGSYGARGSFEPPKPGSTPGDDKKSNIYNTRSKS